MNDHAFGASESEVDSEIMKSIAKAAREEMLIVKEINNTTTTTTEDLDVDAVKKIVQAVGETTESVEVLTVPEEMLNFGDPEFRICSELLPEKTGFWTKVKNLLFHGKKIEGVTTDCSRIETALRKIISFLFQEFSFGKKDNR